MARRHNSNHSNGNSVRSNVASGRYKGSSRISGGDHMSVRSNAERTSTRIAAGTNAQNIPIDPATIPTGANFGAITFMQGANSLRLNTGNIRTGHLSVMLSMLQDPIQCGSILKYCQRTHSSENLCFIMMVSRFRDAMSSDLTAWPKTWQEVDAEVEGKTVTDTIWPSKRLHKSIVQKLVKAVWDNFLSDDAVTQIW